VVAAAATAVLQVPMAIQVVPEVAAQQGHLHTAAEAPGLRDRGITAETASIMVWVATMRQVAAAARARRAVTQQKTMPVTEEPEQTIVLFSALV
jgi:hypothetical protein